VKNHPDRKRIEPITFRAFADEYIERYLKVAASKSWKKAKNRIENIVKIIGESVIVSSIELRDIENVLKTIEEKGDSAGTRNRYRARLRSMWKQAVRWGYATSNPVDETEKRTEKKLGDRYLYPHEQTELLDACSERLRPIVLFAASTGLRQGEILQLRWSDIDRIACSVTVRSETSKTSTERRVPLNRDALIALDACTEENPVFGWDRYPSELWADSMKALGWRGPHVEARLQNWRFHDLRHHCASWLVMNDVPILKVARILGHADLSTTMRYAHLSDSSLEDAMTRIESTMSRPPKNVTALSMARKPA